MSSQKLRPSRTRTRVPAIVVVILAALTVGWSVAQAATTDVSATPSLRGRFRIKGPGS